MIPRRTTLARTALVLVSLFTCGLAGCGGDAPTPTTQVSGTVTYRGNPVAQGTVSFVPVNGTQLSTGEIAQGKYSLSTFKPGDGVPAGDYKVAVTSFEQGLPKDEPGVSLLPAKYLDASSSDLQFQVKPSGSQTIDLELRD